MSEVVSLRPSAGRDVFDLLNALARAGWGVLSDSSYRGARIVLRDLVDASYDARLGRSGIVKTTVPQIMDRTGYKDRWVRESLYKLEEVGLIEWVRGGIVQGRPQPSFIRIIKTALADLVGAARHSHDETLRERAREFEARLRRSLRYLNVRTRARRTRGTPSGTSCRPSPHKGEEGGATAARPTAGAGGPTPEKKDADMRLTPVNPKYLPKVCVHTDVAPARCRTCIDMAVIAQERAILEHQAEQLRRAQEPPPPPPPTPYEAYMRATYPTAHPRQWYRLTKSDQRAKELARATA